MCFQFFSYVCSCFPPWNYIPWASRTNVLPAYMSIVRTFGSQSVRSIRTVACLRTVTSMQGHVHIWAKVVWLSIMLSLDDDVFSIIFTIDVVKWLELCHCRDLQNTKGLLPHVMLGMRVRVSFMHSPCVTRVSVCGLQIRESHGGRHGRRQRGLQN